MGFVENTTKVKCSSHHIIYQDVHDTWLTYHWWCLLRYVVAILFASFLHCEITMFNLSIQEWEILFSFSPDWVETGKFPSCPIKIYVLFTFELWMELFKAQVLYWGSIISFLSWMGLGLYLLSSSTWIMFKLSRAL